VFLGEWVRSSVSSSARHPGEGRDPVTLLSDCRGGVAVALMQRFRDLAAYAAGVSIGCRRSSHFSLAGPREK